MLPRVVIEIRPRLQSCQMYYHQTQSDNSESLTIDVQPTTISIKCSLWEEIYLLDHLKLKPILLNNIKADEDRIISIRLQILVSIDENNPLFITPKYIPNVEKNRPVQITCRFCNFNLLKDKTSFNRVLPLPSSDFNSGDLFCHECCSDDFESRHKIEPKRCDLLYGNYFFKINYDLVCDATASVVKDIVYCQQCKTCVGSKDNVSVKLWNCTVNFDCNTDVQVSPKEDFISVVRNIIGDTIGTMCKIIITCKTGPSNNSEYLLMWIMDRNLPLLVYCQHSNMLMRKNAVKLLYSHERSHSQTVSQWEKDINTHTFEVAEILFTEGLKYLNQSNIVFPKMFRQAYSMNVGYFGI